MQPDYSKLSYQKLDELAWKVIRDWPIYADIDIWKDGLNYHELSAWFLWDKTRAAVLRNSKKEILEKECLTFNNSQPVSSPTPSIIKQINFLSRMIKHWGRRRVATNGALRNDFQRKKKKLLYVPVVSERLRSTVKKLLCDEVCQVVSYHVPRFPVEGLSFLEAEFKSVPDREFAANLFEGICASLTKLGLILHDSAKMVLKNQLIDLTATVTAVEQELRYLQPDAILVHGDNHPPHQVYVMVARKLNIPSIMLQHGLDCEHHYLDEAYASAIAVWGEERERRYRQKSSWQPLIRITGNPQFDSLQFPEAIQANGQNWLWVTRPHTPEKCYAPSRSPAEGLSILESLVKALRQHPDAKLLIKAHPYDYSDKYREVVEQIGYTDRVMIVEQNIHELFPEVKLVISEDTTTGMEAMFWGRPLVHAHFSKSMPTMPFVEYGAALPGFNEEDLIESIGAMHSMTLQDLQKFYDGQTKFLMDFAGLCDGKATERVVKFVVDVLEDDEDICQ